MTNAGTYGDVTWIIWAMVLPYIICFLGNVICKLYEISPSKTVYVKEYVDRPVVKTVYRTKRVTRPQVQQVAIREPKIQQIQVDPVMLEEAVEGLAGLGVKKSQAKKMVKDMTSKKDYSSVEDLLGDCFSQL
jgi:hypothetical protein